ncbi:MAG: hypothetical protein ABI758_03165 [Candidatus Woesebacteria bacterium]
MKSSFLVTLYYTLASIIGLILSVIGAAMLINLVLTTYILKIPRYPSMPPQPFEDTPLKVQQIEDKNGKSLTLDDQATLDAWKTSYAQWQRDQKTYDQANVDKKNQLATSISMLAVGLPVLFFHQRELRKKI